LFDQLAELVFVVFEFQVGGYDSLGEAGGFGSRGGLVYAVGGALTPGGDLFDLGWFEGATGV
jgi:hypothetical protein